MIIRAFIAGILMAVLTPAPDNGHGAQPQSPRTTNNWAVGPQYAYPYGLELTGYEVNDLPETLKRATESGAKLLVMPFRSRGRDSAMVSFPGEYVAEIHAAAGN